MPATAAESAATTERHTPKPVTEYQRTYPGWADQVRHVRRDVAGYLAECPIADVAVLAASEIAANAILHSRSRGGSFTICVHLHERSVQVECRDAGGPWRDRRLGDDRPHGLTIVEALTGPGAWGTETTGDGGRIVWASLTW